MALILNDVTPNDVVYQRLQPDFLGAGFLAADFFFAVRLAGLRALFLALRAVFFLRAAAMIPPSGNARNNYRIKKQN